MPDSDRRSASWSSTDPTLSRRRLLAAGATGLIGSVAGCPSLPIVDGDRGERVLRFGLARPPDTLDPLVHVDPAARLVVNQVAEGLYRFDRMMNLQPLLAVDPPTVTRQARRWIVELDSAARFGDDRPVTATDVQHSVRETQRAEGPPTAPFDMVDRVTALDDRTVQFDLTAPFPAFGESLTRPIIPESTASGEATPVPGQDGNRADPMPMLVGSGPFVVEGGLEDGGVRLRRRDDYWGGQPPRLDAIEFRILPNDTKRIVTLKAREIEAVETVPPSVWSSLSDLEGITMDTVTGRDYYFLAFNCASGPMSDPAVRRAVDRVVDFDALVEEVIGDAGVRTYGPVPRPIAAEWGFPRAEWRAMRHGVNVDRARELLAESEAVRPDWTARFLVPPDDSCERLCAGIAEGLELAGVETVVERLPWPAFRTRYTSGDATDYDAYAFGWRGARDPDSVFYPLFGPHSSGQTDGTHYQGATDAVARARQAGSFAERREAYETAARSILEDVVHIPLFTRTRSLAHRARVKELAAHPWEGAILVGNGFNVVIDDPA